jgi:hypothetical protein
MINKIFESDRALRYNPDTFTSKSVKINNMLSSSKMMNRIFSYP